VITWVISCMFLVRFHITRVDGIVGTGPCDNLGNRLKGEAPAAVTQGRCRGNCNCEQKQVRLVVNKMKREHSAQWQRVESRYGRK